jgi:biopolymer transport protein ExbD
MPIHKPSKVLGRAIALKSAQKQMQSRASRAAWASLNLTAMVDMFTMLVVFLLANFSATGEILFMTKDIVLPKAGATAELIRAPIVSISAKEITAEGKRVIATDEAADPKVTALQDLTFELQELRKAEEMLARSAGGFKGTMILQCDQGVPFSVVRKVMYAAAEAGYVDINYAVMSKTGTLDIKPK